jgi:hypothetical protein
MIPMEEYFMHQTSELAQATIGELLKLLNDPDALERRVVVLRLQRRIAETHDPYVLDELMDRLKLLTQSAA